ncbi:MAG: response regulator, partial [Bacilli bacterium]|nr:response regulator [Bacilli bacterium]
LALERFLSAKPREFDAIFMDMQMPVMDGLEATKRIRASLHPEAKTIPIFAMTANAFAEDVAQCKEAGMNDHLSKPIEMHKVIAVLRAYLKK